MKHVHYYQETPYSKVYHIPESSPSHAHISEVGILLSGEFIVVLPTRENDKSFTNARFRERIAPLFKERGIKHVGFARDNFIPGKTGDSVLIFKRESHANMLTIEEEHTAIDILKKAGIITPEDADAIEAHLQTAPAKTDPKELAQLFDDIRALPPEKQAALVTLVNDLKRQQKTDGPERFIGGSPNILGESTRGFK